MSFGHKKKFGSHRSQGAGQFYVAPIPTFTMKWGVSANTEPNWPTVEGATVTDANGVKWKAMLARRAKSSVKGVYTRASFSAVGLDQYPLNYFKYGVLTWLTGENAGLSCEIRVHDKAPGVVFQLLEAMPYQIDPGDQFEALQGCSKTRNACKNSFNNIHNHRGFPDMPTEDKALATPNFTQQGEAKEQDSGGK